MAMSLATILRRFALALTSLFVVGGLLFALGHAFEDPGGWTAGIIAAAVVVPLVGLIVLAARSAPLALKVLTAAVVGFAVWGLVTLFVDVDAPTVPVISLVLALPIAVLGQRYATRAGELLIAVVARQDALGTSTGVVVVPLVVLALLFLAAGVAGGHGPAPEQAPVQPQTPATRT